MWFADSLRFIPSLSPFISHFSTFSSSQPHNQPLLLFSSASYSKISLDPGLSLAFTRSYNKKSNKYKLPNQTQYNREIYFLSGHCSVYTSLPKSAILLILSPQAVFRSILPCDLQQWDQLQSFTSCGANVHPLIHRNTFSSCLCLLPDQQSTKPEDVLFLTTLHFSFYMVISPLYVSSKENRSKSDYFILFRLEV